MKYAIMKHEFVTEFCNRLINDLELFSQMIEWEYPIEWGIDCEKVIEHLQEVNADNEKE